MEVTWNRYHNTRHRGQYNIIHMTEAGRCGWMAHLFVLPPGQPAHPLAKVEVGVDLPRSLRPLGHHSRQQTQRQTHQPVTVRQPSDTRNAIQRRPNAADTLIG